MSAFAKKSRRCSFETLESRAMLAGNITATVAAGTLTLTGDAADNMVSITQAPGGGWRITGIGTTINGSYLPVTTAPVTNNVNINMGAGNDNLTMTQGNIVGSLSALMGDGADVASLSNLTVGKFLHFEGNAGNDTLTAVNFNVTDPLDQFFSSIDMQDGNDAVVLSSFIDQDLEVTLGAGNDNISISNSTFLNGPSKRLIILAGDGTDVVSLTNVQTGPLTVDVGAGFGDTVSLSLVTADTATFANTGGTNGVLSGYGDRIGTLTVGPGFSTRLGDLR